MKKITFLYFAAALMPCMATAETSVFDEAVHSIVATNADLQARHSRYIGDIETEKAENVLEGPEAEMEYKFAPSGAENRWGVSVSQPFDWPGLYGARSKAARYNADAFRMLYRADRAEVALQARILLLDYVQARRNAALLADAESNLVRLNEYLTKAFERESATILMVKKAKRELFELTGRRIEAESEVRRIAEALKAMGDGSVQLEAVAAYPETTLLPLTDYRDAMMASDPALAARSRLIDAGNARIAVGKAARLPSFSLGYVHDFEEGFHFNGFSVGLRLPSWGKGHKTAAAKAEALAAEFEKEDYLQTLEANLASDWNEASLIAARLIPVKDDFSDDSYVDLLSKSFYGGQLNIFDYLRELNDYIDFKQSLNGLEHRYSIVLARLNRYHDFTDND